jgi:MurNAc alpha-1-phosphate uridylyltransferase
MDYGLERLAQAGIRRFVVNVHYMADQMIAHLERLRAQRPDLDIRISDENDAILDTGGAIARALPHFEGQPFFVHNSDSLWVEGMGSALARMNARWNPETMDCLMLLAACATSIGYDGRGDFEMDAWGVLKRRAEMNLAPFVWTGLQIVHPRLFESAANGRFSIIRCGTGPSTRAAVRHSPRRRLDHVGTPQGLEDAESFLRDLSASRDGAEHAARLLHPRRNSVRAGAEPGVIARAGADPLLLADALVFVPTRRAREHCAKRSPARWAARRCCRAFARSAMSARTRKVSISQRSISPRRRRYRLCGGACSCRVLSSAGRWPQARRSRSPRRWDTPESLGAFSTRP